MKTGSWLNQTVKDSELQVACKGCDYTVVNAVVADPNVRFWS